MLDFKSPYFKYLEKIHPEHEFSVLDAGRKIKAFEKEKNQGVFSKLYQSQSQKGNEIRFFVQKTDFSQQKPCNTSAPETKTSQKNKSI